jgi:hypothetical protein
MIGYRNRDEDQLSTSIETDIAKRAKFYSEPSVIRIISKNGVPKTKKAMEVMISEGSVAKSGVTQALIDCIGFVVFAVHPQQINIRDNATGKIIAVIAR